MPESVAMTRLYRVVGEAEYVDVMATGRFRQSPNSSEGKWFADTPESAAKHAGLLYPGGGFRILAAEVPAEVIARSVRFGNLDRCGPATFIEQGDLPLAVPVLEPDDGE
jgi:hypothetical protein